MHSARKKGWGVGVVSVVWEKEKVKMSTLDLIRLGLGAKSLPVLGCDLQQEGTGLWGAETTDRLAEPGKGGCRMDPGCPLVATLGNCT